MAAGIPGVAPGFLSIRAYCVQSGAWPAACKLASIHRLRATRLGQCAGRLLVEDFPQAKFVHTIRDPISSCDGIFRYHFPFVENHILLPSMTLFLLANKDGPQAGMESRTRAIRFEDLHCNLAETMRDLSDWLGLPYQATLLDSTFNGIPWVVTRDGKAWSGRRLEQVQRQSANLSRVRIEHSCSQCSTKTSWTGTIPVQRSLEIRLSVVSCLFPSFLFR
jgi:hypothetical protein